MQVSTRNTSFLRWAVGVLIICFCNLQVRADGKTLKADLESALVGQTVVSKITFGGRAIPSQARTDYGVNTLVFPESSQVSYRVEWGLIREEVSAYRMLRRFDPGTSFRVTAVEMKDDRLELKLQSGSGDSARLKLMLGAGWQAKFDLQSVRQQLSRIFVLDDRQQPQPQIASTASASTPAPSAFAGATSATQLRHDPNVPKIAGRISDEDLKTVMTEFDQDSRRVFSALSEDATALSQGLLAFQKAYSGRSDYASRPLLQQILQLQDRLGKGLQAQSDEDVIAMSEVFKRCVRISQLGQARDEYGNLYGAGRNSGSFEPLLLSNSAVEASGKVQRDVAVERQQKQPIDRARAAVVAVEQALDGGDLVSANRGYQQIVSDSQIAQVQGCAHYLQLTAAFRQDLALYAQVSQLAHHRDLSASEEIELLVQETNALNASQTKPLTRGLLQSTVSAEALVARQKLDGLPLLQVEDAAYGLPEGADDPNASTLNARLALVTSRISDVDAKLQSATELRRIAKQAEAIPAVTAALGASESASLKQKLEQLATAERIHAGLVTTQRDLQSRIAEVRAEEQRRAEAARVEEQRRLAAARAEAAAKLAAAIAHRQGYADDLTKSMAAEIRWCATGHDNEVLAGVVTTSRLSEATYTQLGAGSPLWKEMFLKGFKFRAILDKNSSIKLAAIKAEGGFAVPVTALSDQDKAALQQTILSLNANASNE